MFHRNKQLQLNLGDSDYAPAINPNSLISQPATGVKMNTKPQVQENEPKPKPKSKPIQMKRVAPIQESKPPTIINNYYYVQPSPQVPQMMQSQPVMDPRLSQQPVSQSLPRLRNQYSQQQQQQQQQQYKHQHQHQNQNQNQNQHQNQYQYQNDQRKSSYNTDYDKFVNSAKPRRQEGSRASSSSNSPNKHSFQTSIYDSVSLLSSGSGTNYRSTDEDLYFKKKMEAKLPIIDLEDTPRRRRINLIATLKNIDDSSLSVHNEELYNIFHDLSNDDVISINSLRGLLCDPFAPAGRLPFSNESVSLIVNTFTSSNKLNFRNFIKLAKFSKGCLVSFIYHDKTQQHMLTFEDFNRALKANAMVCPDELLARIFEKSEDLDFEGYITGIILIRSWERRRNN